MRYGSLIGILFLASVMQGKDVKVHQSGTLLQMDSVECGLAENSGKICRRDPGHRLGAQENPCTLMSGICGPVGQDDLQNSPTR